MVKALYARDRPQVRTRHDVHRWSAGHSRGLLIGPPTAAPPERGGAVSGRLTGARPAETPHLVHGPRDGRFSRLWRASHPPAHPAIHRRRVFALSLVPRPRMTCSFSGRRKGPLRRAFVVLCAIREAGGFDQSYRFAPHLAPERGVAGGRDRVLVWSDPM